MHQANFSDVFRPVQLTKALIGYQKRKKSVLLFKFFKFRYEATHSAHYFLYLQTRPYLRISSSVLDMIS